MSFDPKAMFISFGLVFLAELGDKTQLTTMMLAAQNKSAVAVFVGSALALVMASLLGVVFGEAITRLVPPQAIRTGAAVGFLAIGGFLLLGRG